MWTYRRMLKITFTDKVKKVRIRAHEKRYYVDTCHQQWKTRLSGTHDVRRKI